MRVWGEELLLFGFRAFAACFYLLVVEELTSGLGHLLSPK